MFIHQELLFVLFFYCKCWILWTAKFTIRLNGVQYVLNFLIYPCQDSFNRFLFHFVIIIVSLICLLICCSQSGLAWNCILILLLHFRHLEIINSFDLIRVPYIYLHHPMKTKQKQKQKNSGQIETNERWEKKCTIFDLNCVIDWKLCRAMPEFVFYSLIFCNQQKQLWLIQ